TGSSDVVNESDMTNGIFSFSFLSESNDILNDELDDVGGKTRLLLFADTIEVIGDNDGVTFVTDSMIY
ncbi:unnamed protein product, partial [Rotaria socialis]